MSEVKEAVGTMHEPTRAEKMSVRAEVWVRAWTATAAAEDCKDSDIPSDWADRCLRDFDKKFPQYKSNS